MTTGKIKQVIGPTIDVEFPSDKLPNILNAIKIVDQEKNINVTAEVSTQLGDNIVRCIALIFYRWSRQRYGSPGYRRSD